MKKRAILITALAGAFGAIALSSAFLRSSPARACEFESCAPHSFPAQCVDAMKASFGEGASAEFLEHCDAIENHFALGCVQAEAYKYPKLSSAVLDACGTIRSEYSLQAVEAIVDSSRFPDVELIEASNSILTQAGLDCVSAVIKASPEDYSVLAVSRCARGN